MGFTARFTAGLPPSLPLLLLLVHRTAHHSTPTAAMPPTVDPLGLAKVFVKTVVRMFYDTEAIVVIDALVFHGAIPSTDLVIVLDWGKNSKGANKIAGKLKEGSLIHSYSRQEIRDGAMKSTSREYLYIDYRRAIDATKYRLHMLDSSIKANAAPTQQKKELQCRQCKAQWTYEEVIDCIDPYGRASGFACKTCGDPLDMIVNEEGETIDEKDIPAKFNRFFAPLMKLMQQIDEVTIPAVEGKDAVASAIELPRDKETNPVAKHEVVEDRPAGLQTVKGRTNLAPEKIEVSIATDSELTEAARAKEAERQAKIAAQNQLPSWHTESTVMRDSFGGQTIKSETNGSAVAVVKTESVDAKKEGETDLDDVFARIEAEQRAQEAREAEESSEEEDDEEDEFEDVPTSIAPPEAKRIKLESSAAPSPASGVTPAASTPAGDGGDESEEDEFEDV